MNLIEHNLLPKQKIQKRNLHVKIDLYNYTKELYKELTSKNIIERIKSVPQLGPIRIKRKLSKSRYDYAVLQLYLHKIIRKNINNELELSYNNKINLGDFMEDTLEIEKKDRPTIGDILQTLTIIYNIGHFYNTFTSSRAVLMYANENNNFAEKLIKSSKDDRFQKAAKIYIEDRNYHRLHLLNSIMVLERCNQNLNSIKIAQNMLYTYINQEYLPAENKFYYIFEIFKKVRDISYIAYDLQISNTPLTIDLCDKDALILILREFLSFYNDQGPTEKLFRSLGKLLDDTIYNENSNAICYYQISRRMVRNIDNIYLEKYYDDLWEDKDSILNCNHKQRKDYSEKSILKLTFDSIDKDIAQNLLSELERTNNVKVGYYDRHSGEKTILISIRKKAPNKIAVAFRVLRITIKHLKQLENPNSSDVRFLLVTKFFLHYFFLEKNIVLKATVDESICVICTRGRANRINELNKILGKEIGTVNERHEVKFLKQCLDSDAKNDVSITIPSSILVTERDKQIKISEFDGMIIHPNRKINQIVLLEAKNTSTKPSRAKNDLSEKLDRLNIPYNKDKIIIKDYNAMLKLSI